MKKKILFFGIVGTLLIQPAGTYATSQSSESTSSSDQTVASSSEIKNPILETPESSKKVDDTSATESYSKNTSQTQESTIQKKIESEESTEATTSSSTRDSNETTISSTEESKEIQPVQLMAAQYDENNPYTVSTPDELKAAITSGAAYVKFTANIMIDDMAIPVKNSVVIDGNGFWYMYNGGENWHKGIYFAASGIDITFKNMHIGDNLWPESANNYYGIAPADNSIENSSLILEDIEYYSNQGAQVYHMRDKTNKMILRGKNSFVLKRQPGSTLIQEFAEGTNFIFEEGSDTLIAIEKSLNLGTFWPTEAPLHLELKKNASLEIISHNDLVYTDGAAYKDNKIIVGEGANFSYKAQDKANGRLFHGSAGFEVDVKENAMLLMDTLDDSFFTKESKINLGPGSRTTLRNGNGDFFYDGKGTITIDNAKFLNIESGKPGVNGPTGLNSTTPNILFTQFDKDTKGYGVYESDVFLERQGDTSSWIIDGKKISRTPTAITSKTATALANGRIFKLNRDLKPAEKLGFLEIPDSFDFGSVAVANEELMLTPNVKGKLVVEDTKHRGVGYNGYVINCRLSKPLKNGNTDLSENLSYIGEHAMSTTLSDQFQLVEKKVPTGIHTFSDQWGKPAYSGLGNYGLTLTVPVEKQKVGQFSGELEWQLQDVPSNP